MVKSDIDFINNEIRTLENIIKGKTGKAFNVKAQFFNCEPTEFAGLLKEGFLSESSDTAAWITDNNVTIFLK